jgi:hypothetical protein
MRVQTGARFPVVDLSDWVGGSSRHSATMRNVGPLETAKLGEVEPRAYVTQAAIRAIRSPGAVTPPSDLT